MPILTAPRCGTHRVLTTRRIQIAWQNYRCEFPGPQLQETASLLIICVAASNPCTI
jgi:hypothetical protein